MKHIPWNAIKLFITETYNLKNYLNREFYQCNISTLHVSPLKMCLKMNMCHIFKCFAICEDS